MQIEENELSGDWIPRFKLHDDMDPTTQQLITLHNKLAQDAMNRSLESREQAERINQEWLPKIKRLKNIKLAFSILICFLGFLIIFFILIVVVIGGMSSITLEQLGIILAGVALLITGFLSFASFEDEIYHLLIVARTDEMSTHSDILSIKAQLSYLKLETRYQNKLRQEKIEEEKI